MFQWSCQLSGRVLSGGEFWRASQKIFHTGAAEILFEDLERRGSDDEGPREHCSSDTSMFGAIERLNLMRAIRKLPCGYKQVFLLHDVIGYEHSEIAGLLGCSTGSSKSQLHKARKRLRRLLQGEQGRPEAEVAPA